MTRWSLEGEGVWHKPAQLKKLTLEKAHRVAQAATDGRRLPATRKACQVQSERVTDFQD